MPSVTNGKFRAIAAELEGLIRAGEWGVHARLPSVRAIAERYSVALATAARALEVLHGKGLVLPNKRSGTYVVADRSGGDGSCSHWAVCLRITPGPWQRVSTAVTGSGFFEMARTPGVRLDFDAISPELDLPEAVLRQRVRHAREEGIQGLFFLPSRISDELMRQDERLLEVCREVGLAVVLVERNLRGEHRPLEHDLVCPDDTDGGFRCAMHLLESGCRRLAFIRGGPTSSHNDMLAGFLAAQFQARQRGLLPANAPFPPVLDYPEGAESSDAYRVLCDRLITEGTDGVVCYHDRVVIGLAIELLARGKRVPHDVALTGFDDQPIGQEFTIGVTTYAFPGAELAARAVQVMRARLDNPSAPPAKVLVPSRLIVRESSSGTRPR